MYRNSKTPEEKIKHKTPKDKESNLNTQKSSQENTQDLDQEQHVNANPFQFTSQNVQIVVGENKNNYAGKITGTTYLAKYNKIVSDVVILLYFGNDIELPVCKTYSDISGKFVIDNIPPGYYRIKAYLRDDYVYSSPYIRVLPGENIEHTIFLKRLIKKHERDCD